MTRQRDWSWLKRCTGLCNIDCRVVILHRISFEHHLLHEQKHLLDLFEFLAMRRDLASLENIVPLRQHILWPDPAIVRNQGADIVKCRG